MMPSLGSTHTLPLAAFSQPKMTRAPRPPTPSASATSVPWLVLPSAYSS